MNIENDKLPIVSVLIATYNSHSVLPRTLEALRNQTYDYQHIEIIVIDGGSTDDTIDIAKKYECKILYNPDKDPGTAKKIGLEKANGKYVITLDHDEVLLNRNSIETRVSALQRHTECKIAMVSGYKRPSDYPGLNEYLSEFGDPFSMFMYRRSIGYRFMAASLTPRFAEIVEDTDNYTLFKITHPEKILVELQCFATMLDFEYFHTIVDMTKSRFVQSHGFYEMCKNGDNYLIVAKNDPLEHYSIDSFKAYLPKLRYRVINNVHYNDRSVIGFGGREIASGYKSVRKYMFIPYSLSVLLPFFDGVYLSISRKNAAYMYHPMLCLYVTANIMYEYAKKVLRIPVYRPTYDGM